MIELLEPRINGMGASDVCRRLGKTHWICSDVNSFSGGVWLLWNEEYIKVELLNVHKSFIHIAIKSMGEGNWNFTDVYASPRAHIRKELLLVLNELQTGDPWLIKGDFNCVLKGDERSSGAESLKAAQTG